MEREPLPFPGFKVCRTLGVGTFARVLLAEHEPSGTQIAVKVVQKSHTSDIETVRGFDHPFISHLYAVSEAADSLYLAMEYASSGSLLEYLHENGNLELPALRTLCGQIVMALQYLHNEHNTHHGDLKPENIMLDDAMNVKLIDLGGAHCGSALYLSPEALESEKCGIEADIWSLGVVLYCSAFGRFPFYEANYENLKMRILHTEPFFPATADKDLVDLIRAMLTKDRDARITLDGIVNHAFVKAFHFDDMSMRITRSPPVDDIVTSAQQRSRALQPFADCGIVEVTDQSRVEYATREAKLRAIKPLSVSTIDPLKILVRRATRKGSRKPCYC